MRIRSGDTADLPAIVTMFDEAVAWMVARGNTGQWGTEPVSAQPHRIDALRKKIEQGDLWLAELDDEPAGALITGTAPDHVEQATEPELYVDLLLTSRRYAGRGIGTRLLSHARELAAGKAVSLIRVDCYRGPDEALIRYYERNGFVRAGTFTVGEWPGQLLSQRLQP